MVSWRRAFDGRDRDDLDMSSRDEPGRVIRLLDRIGRGDRRATEELFPVVYSELRRLARAKISEERPGQTLTPTALVNETYLRLVGDDDAAWENRRHFFGAAAEAMRRILIERARAKSRLKRGGDRRRTSLDERLAVDRPPSPDLLALDEALTRLESKDEEMAAVVELRYFAGLTVKETADALEVSSRTVDRRWRAAKAWLYREMEGEAGPAGRT